MFTLDKPDIESKEFSNNDKDQSINRRYFGNQFTYTPRNIKFYNNNWEGMMFRNSLTKDYNKCYSIKRLVIY